jgi:glycosyltransferase involved in cell wall biosynthesis
MIVSVICPVFNTRPDLLHAAARSVLDEADGDCELILVDDASTDTGTQAALAALEAADPRVRVVRARQNGGPARARNLGLAAASHEWIGFVDADDLWAKGRLSLVRRDRQAFPDAAWFAGRHAVLGGDNALTPGPLLSGAATGGDPTRLETPASTRALIAAWLHLGTSIVRKSAIEAAGGFDEALRYGEDWLLFLRLSVQQPLVMSDATTYILRRQGGSLMRSSGRLSRGFSQAAAMARRDPVLRPFRRELRWFHYGVCKDLAMNNLLNHRRGRALAYAVRALSVSPRDLAEFAFFCRQLARPRSAAANAMLGRYSAAEQVDLAAACPAAEPGR